MRFEGQIYEKFFRGEKRRPRAKTVAGLKKLLEQLPDKLPIGDFGEGVALVVFNRRLSDIHLSFESTEDY